MFLSVRVERVDELPDDQQATIELRPDGVIVYFLRTELITADGAEALQALLNTARDAYHQAWGLPADATTALTH